MEYADLLRRLDGSGEVDSEVFEILCGLEQLLADLRLLAWFVGMRLPWDPALARLRRLATQVAILLWLRPGERHPGRESLGRRLRLPETAELTEVYRHLARHRDERLTEYGCARLVVPECLAGAAVVDYQRYVAAASAWRNEDPLHRTGWPVAGLRSGGSYLAPLWAAVLAGPRRVPDYVTVRPPRIGPDNSAGGPPPDLPEQLSAGRATWPELTGSFGFPRGRQLVVVDDQLRRGTTMVACLDAVRQMVDGSVVPTPVVHYAAADGTRPQGTVVLASVRRRVPPVESTDEGDLRDHFERALAELLPVPGLVLKSVERLPEGYWSRYLAASTGIPWRQLEPSLRGRLARRYGGLFRRYRLQCTSGAEDITLVAKYIGFGHLVGMQADALSTASAGPSVVGAGQGYLFYHWVPGTPLDFGSGEAVGEVDLDVMASTVAELHRTAVLRLSPSRTVGWVAAACARLRSDGLGLPDDEVFVRAIEPWHPPVVRAPRNHGHWHWVRSASNGLIRFHRESTMTTRYIDPAGDLAAIALELQLSRPQLEQVVHRYSQRCEDEVTPGRLALGAVSHAALVLAEFDESQAASRQLGAGVRPVADALEPFLRRRTEIGRSAACLVREILR